MCLRDPLDHSPPEGMDLTRPIAIAIGIGISIEFRPELEPRDLDIFDEVVSICGKADCELR